MYSLDTYCDRLLQERGCEEFVIVPDDYAPTAKITPRKNNKALLPDNRPPMCPKRKESSEKLSTIEANNKKIPSSRKINSLKDFFDEITKPGESRSRKERGDCSRISPPKTSLKNSSWGEFLDEGPRFPLKRRGSHDDVATLSAYVCGYQSKTKKSLQVEHVCGEAGIGVPSNLMSPKSARWSARPAIFQKRSISDSAIVQEGSDSAVLPFRR
jgi:hypothetical protein